MIVLLLAALSGAGCPTYATPSLMKMDGTTYQIEGRVHRVAMSARLKENGCDVDGFEEWRRQIRLSRGTGVVGLLVAWPALIATAVHWSNASRARRLLVQR